jgi:hypothetical protein
VGGQSAPGQADYQRGTGYLDGDREETHAFDDYGLTENIWEKTVDWHPSAPELTEQLDVGSFHVPGIGGETDGPQAANTQEKVEGHDVCHPS